MMKWPHRRVVAALVVIAFGGTVPATVADSPKVIKLVRAQPRIVRVACRESRETARVRVTCPTLIPATRYVRVTGLWGPLSSSRSWWGITFNNGDNGPGYVHWIAGGGTMKAMRYFVLRDSQNEVKGLPRLTSRRNVSGYRVAIYKFPPYPAGGPNGGHTLALVQCGERGVFASIHASIWSDYVAAVTAMAVDLARRSGCHS
jgi:hypothetical protein